MSRILKSYKQYTIPQFAGLRDSDDVSTLTSILNSATATINSSIASSTELSQPWLLSLHRVPVVEQVLYEESPGPTANDYFGKVVSLSSDGTRLVVGALQSESATGVSNEGQAFVYRRSSTGWIFESTLREEGTGQNTNDFFGVSVDITADGSRVIVGSMGSEAESLPTNHGQAFVFSRSGTAWTQEAVLYEEGTGMDTVDSFGISVAITAGGDRVVIGAQTSEPDGGTSAQGQAFVFSRSGTLWAQEATLYNDGNVLANDFFGQAVDISADGVRVIVGAPGSTPTGGLGDQGQAFIYTRDGTTWTREAILYEEGAGSAVGDNFGAAVSMSADGSRVAIGAYKADDTALNQGEVFIFKRTYKSWAREAILYRSTAIADDEFGQSVNISADGSRVIVGAHKSSPTGGLSDQGEVSIFRRDGTMWSLESVLYETGDGSAIDDSYGSSVSITADGSRVAIGASKSEPAGGTSGQGQVFIYNTTSYWNNIYGY